MALQVVFRADGPAVGALGQQLLLVVPALTPLGPRLLQRRVWLPDYVLDLPLVGLRDLRPVVRVPHQHRGVLVGRPLEPSALALDHGGGQDGHNVSRELADVLGDSDEEPRGAQVVAQLDVCLDQDVGVQDDELPHELAQYRVFQVLCVLFGLGGRRALLGLGLGPATRVWVLVLLPGVALAILVLAVLCLVLPLPQLAPQLAVRVVDLLVRQLVVSHVLLLSAQNARHVGGPGEVP